jgi:predicted TPR repeat methyltransferase
MIAAVKNAPPTTTSSHAPNPIAQAAAELGAGQLERAEATCRQLLASAPDTMEALHILGIVHAQKGELVEAAALLERVVLLAPNNAAAWQDLGAMQANASPERAEECFRRTIALAPTSLPAHSFLASLLQRRNELDLAAAQLRELLRLSPQHEPAMRSLASISRTLRDHETEIRLGKELLALHPDDSHARAVVNHAYGLHVDAVRFGKGEDRKARASTALQDWLAFEPDHPTAKHLLAAVSGVAVPDRAARDYVVSHFDEFSDAFDEVLVSKLGYVGPEAVRDALARVAPSAKGQLDIVDLGAGTGLLGPLIRPWKKRLTGVDLSPKMLEKARARGTYDELVTADIVEFLREHRGAFDIITCIETLNYFGPLDDVFGAVAARLAATGHFIATIETAATGSYSMHEGGRYMHSDSYLREALAAARLRLVDAHPVVLRHEGGKGVAALVVTATHV